LFEAEDMKSEFISYNYYVPVVNFEIRKQRLYACMMNNNDLSHLLAQGGIYRGRVSGTPFKNWLKLLAN